MVTTVYSEFGNLLIWSHLVATGKARKKDREKKKKAIGIFFIESFRRLAIIFLMNTMFFLFCLSFILRFTWKT